MTDRPTVWGVTVPCPLCMASMRQADRLTDRVLAQELELIRLTERVAVLDAALRRARKGLNL